MTNTKPISLYLPPDVMAIWERIPEPERNSFAVAAIREAAEELDYDLTLTPEDLASLERGLAEADAGSGMDNRMFVQHLRERKPTV